MDIARAGTKPSGKGPSDWFTGTVRIDPLFTARWRADRGDPSWRRRLPLDQVAEGYRAMDERRAIKTLLRTT